MDDVKIMLPVAIKQTNIYKIIIKFSFLFKSLLLDLNCCILLLYCIHYHTEFYDVYNPSSFFTN